MKTQRAKQRPRRWGGETDAGALLCIPPHVLRKQRHRLPAGAVRTEGDKVLYDLDAIADLARREGVMNGLRTSAPVEVDPWAWW